MTKALGSLYFGKSLFNWLLPLGLALAVHADTVKVSPEKLDFGSQPLFTVSDPSVGIIILSNGTHQDMTISSTSLSGDFSIYSSTCSVVLQAYSSCALSVAFRPVTVGTRTGALSIFYTGPADSPQKVKLSGLGTESPGTFTYVASMRNGRYEHTATTLNDGRVLIAGGIADTDVMPVPEIYDPATASFYTTGQMSIERWGPTSTLLPNGKVLIAGGASLFAVEATAEVYDPVTGSFTPTGSMSTPRYRHTATVLQDGRVLIVGGNDQIGPLATAEIYDPNAGTFTPTGSMLQAREFHTATLLPTGKVLIVFRFSWKVSEGLKSLGGLADRSIWSETREQGTPTLDFSRQD